MCDPAIGSQALGAIPDHRSSCKSMATSGSGSSPTRVGGTAGYICFGLFCTRSTHDTVSCWIPLRLTLAGKG